MRCVPFHIAFMIVIRRDSHTRFFTTRFCRACCPLLQIEKQNTHAPHTLDTGKANRGERRRRRLVTVLLHLVVR